MTDRIDEALAAAHAAVHNDYFDAKEAARALLAALHELHAGLFNHEEEAAQAGETDLQAGEG